MLYVVETLRYTYRLRPGAAAERVLTGEWHRCRFLWNEAVHQDRAGRRSTAASLSLQLTEARARSTWLRQGSVVVQQQVLRAFAQSLHHSFTVKGRGRPAFKKRKATLASLEYTKRGFSLVDGALRLPRGVSVPVVWSRDLPSTPTSVRVFQDTLGHWYASFVVRRDDPPLPPTTGGIGIDWGVSTTATTTDPVYDLPHGKHRHRCAADLAAAQRTMARRRRPRGQAQSKGYRNARRDAAKVHARAQRRNTHEARVWAGRVVADHQVIAVEDFKPKFLARSTMARTAADSAIATTKRTLIEYAVRAGREVVLVKPAYTTMTCGECGARAKHRLPLGQRIFRCQDCAHTADRDRNAARVILATAGFNRAGADAVRHAGLPSGEVRVQAEPGIPRL